MGQRASGCLVTEANVVLAPPSSRKMGKLERGLDAQPVVGTKKEARPMQLVGYGVLCRRNSRVGTSYGTPVSGEAAMPAHSARVSPGFADLRKRGGHEDTGLQTP